MENITIHFFGTWAAINHTADTTHFMIQESASCLYVDTWAGASLMQRLLKNEIPAPEFLFLTHAHTDHFLGLFHLVRGIKSPLKVFVSQKLRNQIISVIQIVGYEKKFSQKVESGIITPVFIEEWKEYSLYDRKLQPINLYSSKTEQYGFMLFAGWKKIVFFGDEAVDVLQRTDLEKYENSDCLICESFCTSAEEPIKKPKEKAHITAYEAGVIATKLKTQKLILTHIPDELDIPRVHQLNEIKNDASKNYHWEIQVPMDNESIMI